MQTRAFSIFCDDIRFEQDEKISLVGLYPTQRLVAPTPFPLVLPKLCIWIEYQESTPGKKGDGLLYVYLPGKDDPTIRASVGLELLREHQQKTKELGWYTLRLPLVMNVVTIPMPGVVKVEFEVENERILIGTLAIVAPEPKNVETPS